MMEALMFLWEAGKRTLSVCVGGWVLLEDFWGLGRSCLSSCHAGTWKVWTCLQRDPTGPQGGMGRRWLSGSKACDARKQQSVERWPSPSTQAGRKGHADWSGRPGWSWLSLEAS